MNLISKVVVNLKILVVEDEIILAENIKDSLECLGYCVTDIADSEKEAIAKAALNKPDLVLMDIRLEEKMNGHQVANKIWNNFNIPIIFITAPSDIKTMEQAKKTPFGYISKPFQERELHTAIEMAMYKHELEKKLKCREQWVNTIVTSISDAVIITDHKSCITLLNTNAQLLTGWEQSDALGKNLTEVLHLVQEKTRKFLEIPIAQVIGQNVAIASPEQTILITKNGGEIPIDSNASPLEDEQEIKGVIVVFRDITERKQAEESRRVLARNQQLEEQIAELERLNGLKDDFLSTVSHELRTPMANITMAVKMLELSLGRINELLAATGQQIDTSATVRYLKILKDECGREINLIENLLSLQRLEAGVQTFDSELIHFQTWLAKVVEPFEERAHSRQQTLQIHIPTDLPSIVSDCASVGRIVAELLNNACKYTPPGEHIILTARPKNAKIQLQMCNSGVEIPEKELTRVFDKFYRVPSHDPWKQGGTGLGLALVQKLSEQLGGGIQVESGGGKTCFTVDLPLQM